MSWFLLKRKETLRAGVFGGSAPDSGLLIYVPNVWIGGVVVRVRKSMLRTPSKVFVESFGVYRSSLIMCIWQASRFSIMVRQQLFEQSQRSCSARLGVQEC